MLRCQFCGRQVKDQDALQTHQVVDCPVMEQDDYQHRELDTASVQFKWIMDRTVDHPSIHLISSDLGDTVELKKGNGSYTSSPIQIQTGTYNGQLVIGDDVIAIAEFEIELLSDMIYLIIDTNLSVEDLTSSQNPTVLPTAPHISPRVNITAAPRRRSEESTDSNLSPLHRELLEHQMQHPVSNANLLQEEDDFQNIEDDITSPRRDGFIRSPDDHTMRNVEDIVEDHTSDHHHHEPQEHQQPVESETESHSTHSVNASPRHFDDDNTPRNGEGFDEDSQQSPLLSPRTDQSGFHVTDSSIMKQADFPLLQLDPPSDNEDREQEKGFQQLSPNSDESEDDNLFHMEDSDHNEARMLDMADPLSDDDIGPVLSDENPSSLPDILLDDSCQRNVEFSDVESEHEDSDPKIKIMQNASAVSPPRTPSPNYVESHPLSPSPVLNPNSPSPKPLEFHHEPSSSSNLQAEHDEQNVNDILHELTMTDDDDHHSDEHHSIPIETYDSEHLGGVETLQSEPSFQPSIGNQEQIEHEIQAAMQDIHSPNTHDDNSGIPLDLVEDSSGEARAHSPPVILDYNRNSGGESVRSNEDEIARHDIIPDVLQSTDVVARSPTLPDQIPEQLSSGHQLNGYGGVISRRTAHEGSTGQSGSGYASDASSLAEQISRRNSHDSTTRRRRRTHSHSSQQSQDHDQEDVTKENMITNLKIKCESYESVLSRLHKENEEYKETIIELETKCSSYDEEIDRLNRKCNNMQEQFGQERLQHVDISKRSQVEILEVNRRCQRYEEEVQQIKQDNDGLMRQEAHLSRTQELKDQMIAELEAKCQSFDIELDRVKNENRTLQKKSLTDSRSEEAERKIRSLSCRILELETINLKLKSDAQSLETAHKLHADDLQNENERLNRKITELRNLLTAPNHTQQSPTNEVSPEISRSNIEKLKTENEVLKEKLHNIRIESNPYQPQIISPRTSTGHHNRKITEHLSSKFLKNGSILPDRLERSYTQPESSDSDEKHSRQHSSYTPDKYSSYTTPKDLSFSRDNSMHHTPDRSKHRGVYGGDFVDSMNKKYSPETRFTDHRDKRYTSDFQDNGYSTNHMDRTVDDMLATASRRNRDFLTTANYSSSSRKAKSRSLDLGLNKVGTDDDDGLSTRKHRNYSSLSRIPFCPTHISELAIGMQVSVNRSSGRLSRGTVKWIGNIPLHTGDYVGVELESESGKHNGYLDGRQYFHCKKDRGVFVKFPKVIMAWK